MAKFCALLPILLGAGVFPLSAYALDTIELNSPDGAGMAVAEVPVLRPASDFVLGAAGQEVFEKAVAAHRPSVSFLRIPNNPGRPAEFDATTSAEVSSLLEQVRLLPSPATTPSRNWAAQFVAALAIACLVARRRLVGR